jgi:hypothetical protein
MTLTVYILLAANLSFGLYLWRKYLYKRNRKCSKDLQDDKSVPNGPRGLPLFGHLLHLGTRPYLKLFDWSGKYGPIFRVKLGNQEVVVLNRSFLLFFYYYFENSKLH